jgi:hypothetical protein
MDMPWIALAPVDPSREYLVLLSYLPLRKYRKIPHFFGTHRRFRGNSAGRRAQLVIRCGRKC